MSQNSYPVTVAVRRPDGSVEQVRVGTATQTESGFSLQLGELSIGGSPVAPSAGRSAAPSARPAAPGELPTTLPDREVEASVAVAEHRGSAPPLVASEMAPSR